MGTLLDSLATGFDGDDARRAALDDALRDGLPGPRSERWKYTSLRALERRSFAPADLHLHAGQPVTIHFVNTGSGGHDFTAPEFFTAATMDAANRARVGGAKGRVSLGKGESSDVTLTPRAGTYKAHCSHFMHSSFGMTGKIVVD